jgi:Ca2+-binding EF-hand superfamily protein
MYSVLHNAHDRRSIIATSANVRMEPLLNKGQVRHLRLLFNHFAEVTTTTTTTTTNDSKVSSSSYKHDTKSNSKYDGDDTNSQMYLTARSLRSVLRAAGVRLKPEAAEAAVSQWKSSKSDPGISFKNFLALYSSHFNRNRSHIADVERAFQVIDSDKDGFITVDQLWQFYAAMVTSPEDKTSKRHQFKASLARMFPYMSTKRVAMQEFLDEGVLSLNEFAEFLQV